MVFLASKSTRIEIVCLSIGIYRGHEPQNFRNECIVIAIIGIDSLIMSTNKNSFKANPVLKPTIEGDNCMLITKA